MRFEMKEEIMSVAGLSGSIMQEQQLGGAVAEKDDHAEASTAEPAIVCEHRILTGTNDSFSSYKDPRNRRFVVLNMAKYTHIDSFCTNIFRGESLSRISPVSHSLARSLTL